MPPHTPVKMKITVKSKINGIKGVITQTGGKNPTQTNNQEARKTNKNPNSLAVTITR